MKLSDIHWTFQYDGRSQTPHFGKQLIEILNSGTTPTSSKKNTSSSRTIGKDTKGVVVETPCAT